MSEQVIKLMTLGLYGKKSASARRTGSLGKDNLEIFKGIGGRTIRCTAGTLWLTLEGDTKDYILTQNQSLPIPGVGKVLVSGSGSYQI